MKENNEVQTDSIENYKESQFRIEKETVQDLDDYREFEYGHLIFECNRCGHRETVDKDVKGGINIILPTTNKHEWTIVCPRCKNKMRFFFIESFKKDTPIEPIDGKKKTKRKKKNEPKESNKGEESV